MPSRIEPLITDCIYHVFNKTIDKKEILGEDFGDLMLKISSYYKSSKAKVSYSRLKEIDPIIRDQIFKRVYSRKFFRIEIFSYCLMSTHFHFLLKQKKDNGIAKFISDTLNAFTRTVNLITERKGPLFLTQFKAVRIKNEEQLIHVSRYIHLNPYSSGLVNNFDDLISYKWSSLKNYLLGEKSNLVDINYLLSIFNNDRKRYKKFIFDNADYQRNLDWIKHVENF